eukprot:NODE_9_length_47730_cov_0.323718.p17 type:complete len:281 gc:universal NODE_9_length_47730_cov_0.323718:33199-32357(-)
MTDFNSLYRSLVSKRTRIEKKQKQYETVKDQNKIDIAVIHNQVIELTSTGCIINDKEHFGEYFIGDGVLLQIKHPHYVQILPSNHSLLLHERPLLAHFDTIGAIYCNEAGINTLNWIKGDEKNSLFTPHLFIKCKSIKSSRNHVLVQYKEYIVVYTRSSMVSIKSVSLKVDWSDVLDMEMSFFAIVYAQNSLCKLDVFDDHYQTLTQYDLPFTPKVLKSTKYGILAMSDFMLVHLDMMKSPRLQFTLKCEENDLPILNATVSKDVLYILNEERIDIHALE